MPSHESDGFSEETGQAQEADGVMPGDAEVEERFRVRERENEQALSTLDVYSPALEQMVQSLTGQLEYHLNQGPSPKQALEAIRQGDRISIEDTLASTPVPSLMWSDLRAMESVRAGSSKHALAALRKRARTEIKTGMMGVQAVERAGDGPYQQARYLALLDELSEEWQPRNGIERTLIEQMAQAHYQGLKWQAHMTSLMGAEQRKARKEDAWNPRVSDSQAIDQAMNMTDRFHRIFVRTQRALRDMRRYSINVEHVGQLNVGDQQVNVSTSE